MTLATNRTVLDALDIIETKNIGADAYEICACARALLDESVPDVAIELDAFVRRFEMRGKDVEFRPRWLPRKDIVRIRTGAEEAGAAAKEVFRSWVTKVRATIPPTSEWKRDAEWLPR
ncbi:MAG TPA: hypothetical protein VF773_12650 [Verrucomicrobiae bacterium]